MIKCYEDKRSNFRVVFSWTSSMSYMSRDLIAFWAHFAGTGIMSILSVSGAFYASSWCMYVLYRLWATKFPKKKRNYFQKVWYEYKIWLWISMVVNSKSNKSLKWRLPTWLDITRHCDFKSRSSVSSWKDSAFVFDTINIVHLNC
jgi:hypothetical protein